MVRIEFVKSIEIKFKKVISIESIGNNSKIFLKSVIKVNWSKNE